MERGPEAAFDVEAFFGCVCVAEYERERAEIVALDLLREGEGRGTGKKAPGVVAGHDNRTRVGGSLELLRDQVYDKGAPSPSAVRHLPEPFLEKIRTPPQGSRATSCRSQWREA
ncbi:hypothetical protein UPYG_G00137290 [Umbra pygmaea]|uniref:Uncharacterized protein n=1 Tax=Umbra pygmaea TaxID=75934 RepID=A0ABD0XB01_UMBPY